MPTTTVPPLPSYPSPSVLSALPPSSRSTLLSTIVSALAIPVQKHDPTTAHVFLTSYLAHTAHATLDALIWPEENIKKDSTTQTIRIRTLHLTREFASSLPSPALLDFCIVYPGKSSPISAALSSAAPDLADAFATLLTQNQGLHALRKSARALLCIARAAPSDLAQSTPLILSIASTYDTGLTGISTAYGAEHLARAVRDGDGAGVDDWVRIWLHTKTDLLDAFHLLLQALLSSLAAAQPGAPLVHEAERVFGAVFALLELTRGAEAGGTPFLDRPLLADYEHAYGLSRTLARVLAAADDPRTDLVSTQLQALDAGSEEGAGALRLVLGSGIAPGVDNRGTQSKGKGRAPPEPQLEINKELEDQVAQVLAILPGYDPNRVRALLRRVDGVEAAVGALLEGGDEDAPEPEPETATDGQEPVNVDDEDEAYVYTKERSNIWDAEEMDLERVHRGKKTDDATALLHDSAEVAQLKADILRRAELISDDDDEDETRPQDLAFEDEDAGLDGPRLRVRDGSEDGESGEEGEEEEKDSPETVLERAYLRDAGLFARDAATRRGKAREALRTETGWTDEQIEGWRIMLERNPKKDKILEKHEFAGNNRVPLPPSSAGATPSSSRGGGPRGRGGGRGGRGGGGRGGGSGHDGGGGSERERAWKERRGNQARKRGRDRKMARAGAPG